MKNKFIVGTITVFAAIFTGIFILNFSNSSSNKSYSFDRKFSEIEILKFENKFKKLNLTSVYQLYYSNTTIIEGELNDNEIYNNNYNFYFSNQRFTNKKNVKAKLPKESNILLVDENCVVYNYESKIHKLDFVNNKTINTSTRKIDISFMISLDEFSNKFLFYGEVLDKENYKAGFFILDISNNTIIDSKIIASNKKSFQTETILMNSGYFQKTNDNSIFYICDKNPKIFLFNDLGIFINDFKTKDNTPMPKVIYNSDSYFYSQDGLSFSNSGLFTNKNNIFVFSMASNFKDLIVIDQYSRLTMKYVQSYKLKYEDYNSRDISNVFIDGNKIILKIKSSYASFTFSRYI